MAKNNANEFSNNKGGRLTKQGGHYFNKNRNKRVQKNLGWQTSICHPNI